MIIRYLDPQGQAAIFSFFGMRALFDLRPSALRGVAIEAQSRLGAPYDKYTRATRATRV